MCCLFVKLPCTSQKLTLTGRLAKHQFELKLLPEYFQSIYNFIHCGFDRDLETGKPQRTLYHAKIATVRLNGFPGKQREVQSLDPAKGTTESLITNQLYFEAAKSSPHMSIGGAWENSSEMPGN